MRVKLVRSGGFAGLSLVATVDAAELPLDQQDIVSRLLSEDVAGPAVGGPAVGGVGRPGAADQFSYELEIQHGNRTVRRHWQEPAVDQSVRPLLETLTREARPAR